MAPLGDFEDEKKKKNGKVFALSIFNLKATQTVAVLVWGTSMGWALEDY